MAEIMLSDQYRSSLQSLENLAEEQPSSQPLDNQPLTHENLGGGGGVVDGRPPLQPQQPQQPRLLLTNHCQHRSDSTRNDGSHDCSTTNVQPAGAAAVHKKQVTHGPTVVIEIPQSKRCKTSKWSTKQVVEGEREN